MIEKYFRLFHCFFSNEFPWGNATFLCGQKWNHVALRLNGIYLFETKRLPLVCQFHNCGCQIWAAAWERNSREMREIQHFSIKKSGSISFTNISFLLTYFTSLHHENQTFIHICILCKFGAFLFLSVQLHTHTNTRFILLYLKLDRKAEYKIYWISHKTIELKTHFLVLTCSISCKNYKCTDFLICFQQIVTLALLWLMYITTCWEPFTAEDAAWVF